MNPLFFCQKCLKNNFSYLFSQTNFKNTPKFHSTPRNETYLGSLINRGKILETYIEKCLEFCSQYVRISTAFKFNSFYKSFLPNKTFCYNSYVPVSSFRNRNLFLKNLSYVIYNLYITQYCLIIYKILSQKTLENNYYHNRKLRYIKEFLDCRG